MIKVNLCRLYFALQKDNIIGNLKAVKILVFYRSKYTLELHILGQVCENGRKRKITYELKIMIEDHNLQNYIKYFVAGFENTASISLMLI